MVWPKLSNNEILLILSILAPIVHQLGRLTQILVIKLSRSRLMLALDHFLLMHFHDDEEIVADHEH